MWERSRYFAWTPHGLFRASLLGDLRFCADIKAEDVSFDARLFVAANGIKIGCFVGYIYRIRANSVSDYTLNENLPDRKVAPFMQDMARCFSRSYELSTYYNSYSYAMLCLCIERLRRGLDASKADLNDGLIGLIAKHIDHAFFGISFENDPRDVKGLLMELRPYIGLVKNKRIRRAYLYPKWARFLDLVRMPDVYWRRFRNKSKDTSTNEQPRGRK